MLDPTCYGSLLGFAKGLKSYYRKAGLFNHFYPAVCTDIN